MADPVSARSSCQRGCVEYLGMVRLTGSIIGPLEIAIHCEFIDLQIATSEDDDPAPCNHEAQGSSPQNTKRISYDSLLFAQTDHWMRLTRPAEARNE